MRNIFISLIVLFVSTSVSSQTNAIVFNYDNGGNVIQRQLQVIPMRLGKFDLPKDSNEVKPLSFKVFPNPTNQILNIEGKLPDDVQQAEVILLNVEGKILKNDSYSGEPKTMDVSDLKSGIYMLEINYSKKNKSTYKIIVTN